MQYIFSSCCYIAVMLLAHIFIWPFPFLVVCKTATHNDQGEKCLSEHSMMFIWECIKVWIGYASGQGFLMTNAKSQSLE